MPISLYWMKFEKDPLSQQRIIYSYKVSQVFLTDVLSIIVKSQIVPREWRMLILI
jgi:hypothetical protein